MAKASRDSVRSFSNAEEDFFRSGEQATVEPPGPIESFSDLDEGYQRPTLWQRLFGKKPASL
jgi:hypothetical protein